MVTREDLLSRLPEFKNDWKLLHHDQTVTDIIKEVLKGHKEFAADYDRIYYFFDAYKENQEFIFDALYKFCRKNLKYVEEPEEEQTVASPGAMLTRGHCDCKGYSGFIGGILSAMNRSGANIDWCYRFASYNLFNPSPHHVFIVVNNNGEEIWIDPTPGSKDKSPQWFIDKKVHDMPLYKISGTAIGDTTSTTSTGTGMDALGQMFNAFATGADPTQAIIKFAASPQAGMLIKGITSNIKSLVEGIEDIFHREMKSALVKVYEMFPINTQYPSYVQMDAQINAIRAYVANMCETYTKCQSGADFGACEWMGAYQAVVASYGTLSTWLKCQEAINNYMQDNPISKFANIDINPVLVAVGGYLYLTGGNKQQHKTTVTGIGKVNTSLLLLGIGAGLYFTMRKKTSQPVTTVAPDYVTNIATLPTETELLANTTNESQGGTGIIIQQ